MEKSKFEIFQRLPSFTDERGKIWNILESNVLEGEIRNMALYSSLEGAVRGNHYHPMHTEVIYLVSGSCEIMVRDLNRDGDIPRKYILEPNDMVILPARVAHALRFFKDSFAYSLSDAEKKCEEYTEHTIPYKLLE